MLTSERLILRGARQSDLMDLHAVYRDPRAMRYWSTPPHDSPARTQKSLDRLIANSRDLLTYFVVEKDGRAIGTAGVHAKDEVGYLLHPDYWRQGLMSEALNTLIPHLFDITDHKRLTAEVDPRNQASCQLLLSLGFVETHRAPRTYCIAGKWSDSVYYALPRPMTPV